MISKPSPSVMNTRCGASPVGNALVNHRHRYARPDGLIEADRRDAKVAEFDTKGLGSVKDWLACEVRCEIVRARRRGSRNCPHEQQTCHNHETK